MKIIYKKIWNDKIFKAILYPPDNKRIFSVANSLDELASEPGAINFSINH